MTTPNPYQSALDALQDLWLEALKRDGSFDQIKAAEHYAVVDKALQQSANIREGVTIEQLAEVIGGAIQEKDPFAPERKNNAMTRHISRELLNKYRIIKE